MCVEVQCCVGPRKYAIRFVVILICIKPARPCEHPTKMRYPHQGCVYSSDVKRINTESGQKVPLRSNLSNSSGPTLLTRLGKTMKSWGSLFILVQEIQVCDEIDDKMMACCFEASKRPNGVIGNGYSMPKLKRKIDKMIKERTVTGSPSSLSKRLRIRAKTPCFNFFKIAQGARR